MPLTHTQLQALKPREKSYKVTDRDGLYIDVLPTGSMTWRFQYYLHSKREKLTIGRYPEITLAEARKMRDEAARLVAVGKSPAKAKREDKVQKKIDAASARTVMELAERWFTDEVAFKSSNWQYSVRNWLKLDIYPVIGNRSPREVTSDDVGTVIDKIIERNSPASAEKVRVICMKIFQYALDHNELDINPVVRVKSVRLPESVSHRALGRHEIGPFLRALDAIGARDVNKLAIKMMLLTFTRKDELRLAKWAEFDLENGVWEIPAHRMKMRKPHRVYLSRQVLEILAVLKVLAHGSDYVFPNNSTLSKPIGHTTINSIIDRLDIQGARFVPHGFRATASSILNEAGFRPDVIERQLAHKDQNKVRAVYNQAEYADERRIMLQQWADYVDALKAGGNVIPINARRVA